RAQYLENGRQCQRSDLSAHSGCKRAPNSAHPRESGNPALRCNPAAAQYTYASHSWTPAFGGVSGESGKRFPVMAGLVPAIHVFLATEQQDVDAIAVRRTACFRTPMPKAGHDD